MGPRVLLGLALVATPSICSAQEILIRRVVTPPPSTFAGLLELKGVPPGAPCDLPIPPLDTTTLTTIALGDTASLGIPPGWSVQPLFQGEDEFSVTRLAGDQENRVYMLRRRNGSEGRRFLMYRNNEVPVGTTCTVTRGAAGVVWTFYQPDPTDPPGTKRPYMAYGEALTPAGRWYGLTVYSASSEQNRVAAAAVTAITLLP